MQLPLKKSKSAAKNGNAVAQNNLGVMYEKEDGVPQDFENAVRWWKAAAKKGPAAAQGNLGAMNAFGTGINKNYECAYILGKIAAINGHKAGNNLLGFIMTKMTLPQSK